MIELEIPRATPSINALFGQHWAKRARQKDEWHWLVKQARLDAKVFVNETPARAKVTITRYGPRMLDDDNCWGGAKLLIDCLVRERLIENDTPNHIELIVKQHVSKPSRTIVQIEAI